MARTLMPAASSGATLARLISCLSNRALLVIMNNYTAKPAVPGTRILGSNKKQIIAQFRNAESKQGVWR
jgi:hypothetical protein